MPTPPPITTVALDMYETLVRNGVDLWQATFEEIVEAQSLSISGPELWREWRSRDVEFRRTRTNIEQPQASLPFRTYYDAWRGAFTQTFRALGLEGDAEDAARRCTRDQALRPAYPDALEVLPKLQKRSRLGLLSNADHPYLTELVERHGWSFEPVVSSESARAYKPDPRIFEAFCRQASVAPEQVLYVGDSHYDDVHGAKLCGLRTVWVRRGQETPGTSPPPDDQELLPPDFEIASLQELEGILLREAKPG